MLHIKSIYLSAIARRVRALIPPEPLTFSEMTRKGADKTSLQKVEFSSAIYLFASEYASFNIPIKTLDMRKRIQKMYKTKYNGPMNASTSRILS